MMKVSNTAGATVEFPSGALTEGVTVSAAKAPQTDSSSSEGLPGANWSISPASVILRLNIGGSIRKSITIVLQHTGPARRHDAVAGVLTRMHWLNKKTLTWIESCGEHSPSPPGHSVRAVIRPSVLNHPDFNPMSGCALCDGDGGIFALIDIQAANSVCLEAKSARSDLSSTEEFASPGPNAGLIGSAMAGAVAGAGVVVIALGSWHVYRGRSGNRVRSIQEPQRSPGVVPDHLDLPGEASEGYPAGTPSQWSPPRVANAASASVAIQANQDSLETKRAECTLIDIE